MIEVNIRGTRQGLDIDLLPWADPYIMQLFLEAEMLGNGDESGTALAPSTGLGGRSAQAVAAALHGDSWGINSTRRPSPPRRRRIEAERLLVRC
jgi:hypothetical protein